MICEGCYYKYEGNVYFVAEPDMFERHVESIQMRTN